MLSSPHFTPRCGSVSAFYRMGLALLSLVSAAYGAPVADWTQNTNASRFSGRANFAACVYKNQMWVIGGAEGSVHRNDVWRSADGITWTLVTSAAAFSARIWHQVVAFQGKMILTGGYNAGSNMMLHDVWESTDGAQWTKLTDAAQFPARTQFAALAYNNKLWVIGGWNNITTLADVWSSIDGVNWIQSTGSANCGSRAEHRMVEFNGKMWVSGGSRGDAQSFNILNDVWSSTDGVNWIRATASAGFAPRWGHEMLAANTRLVVIGGCGGSEGTNLKNDAWSSSDGVVWTQETAGAAFSPRFTTRGLTFANRLWLLGGRIATAMTMAADNVWYSDVPVPVELSAFAAE